MVKFLLEYPNDHKKVSVMENNNKPLEVLNIFSFKSIQMKTFHISWITFFVCFFGWFGLSPLMPIIRNDLQLTKSQVGNIIIASVTATILARIIIGKIIDSVGPRKTYAGLLIICAIPTMLVGLANNYINFLLFRLAIGLVGSSFVLTQMHTATMFSPKIKGTATAVAAGWGNMGAGVTNILMPVILAAIMSFGISESMAWRYAMIIPGIVMLIMAFIYYKYTKDTPAGNFEDVKIKSEKLEKKTDWTVLKDWRLWSLTMAYAVCFGMEITFNNIGALHFADNFHLSTTAAGFLAGIYGCMNLFARAIGGKMSDKLGRLVGIRGKGWLLAVLLMCEGLSLLLFSNTSSFFMAVFSMIVFAVFIQMANGATFGIVPFLNEKNSGLVSGIVGAGGNIGGMIFGFLFKTNTISYNAAFLYIGFAVIIVSIIVLATKFETNTTIADDNKKLSTILTP